MYGLELETTGEFDRSMKPNAQHVREVDKNQQNGGSDRRRRRVAEPIFR
jgi:hypothetical protein